MLLAWTSADLCGGLCMHDHEPIAAVMTASPGGAPSISSSRQSAAGPQQAPPDDCFCCSHFVHPQVRYQVVPAYTFVATVSAAAASRPQFPASQLYHPPIGL